MPDRLHTLSSPAPGCVIGIEVEPGQLVAAGQVLATLESMKMELALEAPAAGIVEAVCVAVGEVVQADQPLLRLREGEVAAPVASTPAAPVPRGDLQRLEARRARLDDAARPQAIARRHAQGGRSARENVA
ncbi:MAG: biotin/lipoyl-binding protein, partial [Burkholderiaceae bacterium]|nr:biotin/lipoyl-binding protein [Burkholderiaceae bacterium]